ncbi:MAG: hypothetical protein ACT4P5_23580, partial [Armatimonadota bacterium]
SLASVSAWRVGGNLDLGRVMGITMWGANLDFAYENYGGNPNPAGIAGFWAPPTHTYGTTFTGQYHTWDMRGFYGRLNLTFSPRTAAWILYQGGTRISTGQNYNEWWLRFTHRVATNTTVALNYFKTACGTTGGVGCPGFAAGGDIDHFYRAELLYNW